jgi:phosphate starvation-inducible protein PhoH and related proteins
LKPAPDHAEMVVDFDDNKLMAALCGSHDRNLARIERLLGVSLTPRGNRVMIAGANAAARAAKTALTRLYDRLRDGEHLGAGEIDGAVRMAQAGDDEQSASGTSLRTRKRKIVPRSPNQGLYINALAEHTLVFGIGPAGTGKTYLAVSMAVSMLLGGDVDRIILSRPAVEAGERLGFLPGDLREKIDPYLRPLYDALYDMLPAEQVVKRLESGEIEVAPLAFMRGRTLANAFVILDEAQNTTPVQMKMFLTRLGENSRMAITGDPSQVDLPLGQRSGLNEALDILDGVEGVAMVRFGQADVVRHPLVTRIVRAYEARELGLGDDRRR